MQTQIRLLLEEQSDQVLHCLLFHLSLLHKFLFVEKDLSTQFFRVVTANIMGVQTIKIFTVNRDLTNWQHLPQNFLNICQAKYLN